VSETTVFLGPFKLSVSIIPRKDVFEERDGCFGSKGCTIQIADDLKGVDFVACLLHEFTHAVFYFYGIDELLGDEKEELITFALANGLTQMLIPFLGFAQEVNPSVVLESTTPAA